MSRKNRCFWCSADIDQKMPNGVSPHATYCLRYRAPALPNVAEFLDGATATISGQSQQTSDPAARHETTTA